MKDDVWLAPLPVIPSGVREARARAVEETPSTPPPPLSLSLSLSLSAYAVVREKRESRPPAKPRKDDINSAGQRPARRPKLSEL
jgi:hypothetical protein